MDGNDARVFALFICFLIVAFIGGIVGESRAYRDIEHDCAQWSAFELFGKTYDCKVRP